MPFEKFTKTGKRFKPIVSIWNKGQIGFSQGAIKRFDLKDYKYAILFFDRENRRIGIKFTNDESEEGIIKINFRQTGGVISGKAFLEYFGIDYSKTTKYDMAYDETAGLYVLNLE